MVKSGHENLAITLGNYYQPSPEQQFDILPKAGKPKKEANSEVMEFVRMQMEKEKQAKNNN